jgi:hypothetical protein
MNHQELAAGYKTYDVIDCKGARESLRWYKTKAHKKMRRGEKKEIQQALAEN